MNIAHFQWTANKNKSKKKNKNKITAYECNYCVRLIIKSNSLRQTEGNRMTFDFMTTHIRYMIWIL